MDWVFTLVALAICVSLAVFSEWWQARPVDIMRPRLFPWRAVTIIAAFAAFLMIVHLVNLAGFVTGDPRYR
jgi:hypothetical protein